MKRLTRSKKDRMLFGVCGGIGDYFDIDPVIIRIIFIILLFTGGSGFLAYIIAIFVIPENNKNISDNISYGNKQNMENNDEINEENKIDLKTNEDTNSSSDIAGLLIGIVLIFFGAVFLMKNFSFMNETYYLIIEGIKKFFWPSLLIGLGFLVIYKNK